MLSKVSTKSRRARRGGLTLIELLVVVLVLAILMAVALPPYLNSVSDAQTNTCRANMQTIANAVRTACVRTGSSCTDYSSFAGPVTTSKEQDLQSVPVCPTNGTYTVGISDGTVTTDTGTVIQPGQFYVKCSNHGVYAPDVDSH